MHCLAIFPGLRSGLETRALRHWIRRHSRTIIFIFVWFGIFLAETYDIYFAWHYREMLAYWELNPFILWLAGVGGLASVFFFKILTIFYSTILAAFCHHRRHRMEIPYTVVVGGINFMLCIHYLINHLQC